MSSTETTTCDDYGLGSLDEHLRTCVVDAATAEADRRDEKITEAVAAIERLLSA